MALEGFVGKFGVRWVFQCRDLVARANMMVDLFVVRRSPKFLGQRVTLPDGN